MLKRYALTLMLAACSSTLFAAQHVEGMNCPPPELVSAAGSALNKFHKAKISGQIYEYTVSSSAPAFSYHGKQWIITVMGIATDDDNEALSIARARVMRAARIRESHYGCGYMDNIDNDLAVVVKAV